MRRKEGYRNYTELTEKDIDEIVDCYFNSNLLVKDIGEKFKLTKRTMAQIFKARGIDSHKKNRYTLNESYFENIDSERKAYWLGYLFADGFVGDEHYHNIVFSQKESDGYIVEEFAKDIGFTGKIRKSMPGKGTFKNGQPQMVVNFSSLKMAKDLYALKMYPRKSMDMKELPPIQEELMPHFIRGYFDGDGSIHVSVRTYYKGRPYKGFHWNIIGTEAFNKKIAEKLPVKTLMRDSHTPEMKYLTTDSNKSVARLHKYLYDGATIFLKRKHDIFQQAIGYVNRKLLDEKRDKPDKGCPAA